MEKVIFLFLQYLNAAVFFVATAGPIGALAQPKSRPIRCGV